MPVVTAGVAVRDFRIGCGGNLSELAGLKLVLMTGDFFIDGVLKHSCNSIGLSCFKLFTFSIKDTIDGAVDTSVGPADSSTNIISSSS